MIQVMCILSNKLKSNCVNKNCYHNHIETNEQKDQFIRGRDWSGLETLHGTLYSCLGQGLWVKPWRCSFHRVQLSCPCWQQFNYGAHVGGSESIVIECNSLHLSSLSKYWEGNQ